MTATTLILLAEVELLRQVTSEFHASIPKSVHQEVLAKQSPDAELKKLEKLSLGTLAEKLDVSLVEAIDFLVEIGIEASTEYEDYLRGLELLQEARLT